MKKFILTLISFLLLTSFALAAGPYIYTKPSEKDVIYTVIINGIAPGTELMSETDGSLLIDLERDLKNFKPTPGLYKFEIFSENDYGSCIAPVVFNLRVYKTVNSTVYKIEPINDPLLVNFDKDNLEVAIIKPGGGKKGGGKGSFFGLF